MIANSDRYFVGTTANGVTTSWEKVGPYASFTFGNPFTGLPDCPSSASPFGGDTGYTFDCGCASFTSPGGVRGSDPYEEFSSLCSSAVHAGVITKLGGEIHGTMVVDSDTYFVGTTANGITTSWEAVGPYAAYSFGTPFTGLPDCPSNGSVFAGIAGFGIDCMCHAVTFGSVWGSDPYEEFSSLCTAAVHAGVIGVGGGEIDPTSTPYVGPYFVGTKQNAVTTNWEAVGPYTSFTFGAPFTGLPLCPSSATVFRGNNGYKVDCSCPPVTVFGTVWGTDTYTDDSAFCTAGVHAGAITTAGGEIWAFPSPGLTAYYGSSRNGISSLNYGQWVGSVSFQTPQ